MLIALAVTLMLAMAAYDLPRLIRCKEWGELGLYTAIWIVALTLSILQITAVSVPNPTTVIMSLMAPLGEALLKLLGIS